MDGLDAKVAVNAYRATTPNTQASAERWLRDAGVKFVDVWFYRQDKSWLEAPQVNDPDTLHECIGWALRNHRAGYALWHDGATWCLLKSTDIFTIRRYPSKEAAEMVAIHHA